MAGMWIPWECGLARKSEVLKMAKICKEHPHAIAARCMIVWEWAQDQTVNGIIQGLSPGDVSDAVGVPGIGEAMADPSVGWIFDMGDDGISFPNWERFNGEPAKQRAVNALRKRSERRRRALDQEESR